MSEKRIREELIQLRVTADEKARIVANAKEAKMQMGPYVRHAALNPVFYDYDYSVISNHTR